MAGTKNAPIGVRTPFGALPMRNDSMLFNSVIFIFFFIPFVWIAYLLSWRRSRNLLLLLASIIFYVWGEKDGAVVLFASILFNYLMGLWLDAVVRRDSGGPASQVTVHFGARTGVPSRLRKRLLAAGVAGNLALLVCYKYTGFLLANLGGFQQGFLPPATVGIHTPLGISFFTFHALSYLIDIYRSDGKAQKNPLNFSLYMAMFPKILAGPILQYRDAAAQLTQRDLTVDAFAEGIRRFVIGLGKKTLIATPLAGAADRIFAVPANALSADLAWLGIFCFTLQIYFDFSGYSDMAIGLGKTFGFRLPENFNYPYVSQSVQEFWRRWHISLSLWFRDYLYIPLGGNRCGTGRLFFNLFAVFLLCGLWHGAGWNYIVWGLWYGTFLIFERTPPGRTLAAAPRFWRHLYTLAVVVFGWVFFRSDNLTYAFAYLKAMLGFGSEAGKEFYPALFMDREVVLCLLLGTAGSLPIARKWASALVEPAQGSGAAPGTLVYGSMVVRTVLLGLLFFFSCMSLAGGTHNPFIYFKF